MNPPPLPPSVTVTAEPVRSSSLWPLVVLVLGLAAICGVSVYVMPPDHLDHALEKIGSGISWFVSDPAGAVATIAGVAGAIVSALVLLHITPPGWLIAITTARTSKPEEVRPTRTGGFVDPKLLVYMLGFGGILVFVIACVHGCSPSELQVNATLASGAGLMVDTACTDGVEVAREADQRHAVDAYDTREAATAAVAAVRDRWEPYVFGCRILADAQNAWADALVGIVAHGGQFSLALVLPPMSRFASGWDDFVALHPPMPDGIVLPTIDPSILAALATLVPTEGAE